MCDKCNKDHSKKNEGILNICELDSYLKNGARFQGDRKGTKGFGTGNRFQFSK